MIECSSCLGWFHCAKNEDEGYKMCERIRYKLETYSERNINWRCSSCKEKQNNYDLSDDTTDARMRKIEIVDVDRDEFIKYQKECCIEYIDTLCAAINTRVKLYAITAPIIFCLFVLYR